MLARAKTWWIVLRISFEERLVYRQVLQTGVQSYVGCISRGAAEDKDDPVLFPGRVTRYLETRLASGTYDFYLCGRREMIRDVTLLVDEAFPGSRVYAEIFFSGAAD